MIKRVLILDGDSVAYKCSAAGEERSIIVTHQPTGITKKFKHRTEFKQSMLAKSKEITDDYSVVDHQEPEPLEHVLATIKRHVERIVNEVNPEELIIYAGEENNFRLNLNLPSKYKGNRSGLMRPVHLSEAKAYLTKKYNAKKAYGFECDDATAISAYTALKQGKEPVMYFYEKDQYQLDGVTLLYDEDEFRYEKVPVLGELHLQKTAVKGLGLKFLAYQWICSDPVDNYKAYELSKVKFGAKTAYNLLKDCKDEREVLTVVVNQFKKFYPEEFTYTDWKGETHDADWEVMLRLYYKACCMMRSEDDELNPDVLFEKYGVEV